MWSCKLLGFDSEGKFVTTILSQFMTVHQLLTKCHVFTSCYSSVAYIFVQASSINGRHHRATHGRQAAAAAQRKHNQRICANAGLVLFKRRVHAAMNQLLFRTKPPQMSTQQDKLGQSSNPKPSRWIKPTIKPLNKPLTFSGDAEIHKMQCMALMPRGKDPKTGRTIYGC